MGKGFFLNGKFHLQISLRYPAAPGEIDFWCQLMEQVSRLLYNTTDGQHSIGQVFLSQNSMGGADADIWVHPAGTNIMTNSTNARLWLSAQAMDIRQNDTPNIQTLTHELCHYLYDLGDEYENGAVCLGNPATHACMMERYAVQDYTLWKHVNNTYFYDWAHFFPAFQSGNTVLQQGQVTEFCHAENHDPTQNDDQNNYNHEQSCWTYITDHGNATPTRNPLIPVYGLTAPGFAGPTSASPGLPAPVTCTELIPVQRYMLVLDKSESMNGTKLSQLKVGANFWVDYLNPGEEFGLVSYSMTPMLNSEISEVPSQNGDDWRAARHAIVDGLVDDGSTAIGDALRVALNEITAGGRASSQVIILFTDGLQNAGEETAEDVLSDLIAAGIRCYTIGLGTDQNGTML